MEETSTSEGHLIICFRTGEGNNILRKKQTSAGPVMPQVKKVKSLQVSCLDSIADNMSKSRNYDDVERVKNLGVNGSSPFDLLRE